MTAWHSLQATMTDGHHATVNTTEPGRGTGSATSTGAAKTTAPGTTNNGDSTARAVTIDELSHHRHSRVGISLLSIIGTLVCFGGVMVFSAGASVDQELDWSRFWQFATLRRLAFVPVVWAVLLLVARCDYRALTGGNKPRLLSPVMLLMVISLALLVLVLIPGIGLEINYSRRWLNLGIAGLTFQPSELAKWITPMFLALYAALQGERIRRLFSGFLPACLLLGTVVGLVGKEDFGTAALIAAVGGFMLMLAGVRPLHLLSLVLPAAGAFYLLIVQNPYRLERLMAFMHPEENADAAYQASQSIMAIGSGGIWGAGLGAGTIKMGGIPEDTTDFIFAVIGEELGLVGCSLVIGLFIALLICGMIVIRRCPDRLGRMMAAGITATIGAQAVMNLMVVTGMAPTKGIALPFVSAGGTGLIITAAAAGILINIADQSVRRQRPGNHPIVSHSENDLPTTNDRQPAT